MRKRGRRKGTGRARGGGRRRAAEAGEGGTVGGPQGAKEGREKGGARAPRHVDDHSCQFRLHPDALSALHVATEAEASPLPTHESA